MKHQERRDFNEQVFEKPIRKKPGYELTSEDVVYSLQKAAAPKRSAFCREATGMLLVFVIGFLFTSQAMSQQKEEPVS